MIGRIAPGFFARLGQGGWREPFRRAVQFYVNGNLGVPIEIGVILAQSGLELLAWSTFVPNGSISPKEFEKQWPADRQLRRLLQLASVPTAVPAQLANLARDLPGLNASDDAPTRVSWVRNKIVHPPRNRAFYAHEAALITDTWRLSLTYLELSLLFLCGYSGDYQSRIDGGVAAVPW
jgi:hypothetical protein